MFSRATGVGHRKEIATELLFARERVDFVEVVAESCFAQRDTRREAAALASVWPVVPHGVKLSLGSADGIDEVRLERLAALCRELRAPLVSEHVAFTRGGRHEIGHLTELPRTRAALEVLAANVAKARRVLPDIPLLLENVAFTFPSPDHEMDEPTFYQEVVRRTGCDLLLDVGNLYANAVNSGHDPLATLRAFPLEQVAMLHVAGGVWEDGFYFDTHAHAVPDAVYRLIDAVLKVSPDVPILLERDAGFESFVEIAGELSRLRNMRPDKRGAAGATPRAPEPPASVPVDGAARRRLVERQAAVAALLVGKTPDWNTPLAEAIGAAAIARARGVLERKRVDDALPLLGRLGARIGELRALAERVTHETERARRGAGPKDARAIARAALAIEALADDAAFDALLLEARFAFDGDGSTPRRGPFVGSVTRPDGSRLRAYKGIGAFAPVRLWESGSRAAPVKPVPAPSFVAPPP